MRYLFLGDLHGNRSATEAVEKALPSLRADEIWFMGDAVGKGPDSVWTCDWVRGHCDHFIGGNWDYGIASREFPRDVYYWEQLGEERMQWLNSLPPEAELTLSGLRIRLFHGRPVSDLLACESEQEKLQALLTPGDRRYDIALYADCHRPFIRTVNGGYIMNTGSVGNSMGMPRAHCLLLEGGSSPADPLLSTVISLPYDNEAAVARAMEEDRLPLRDAWIRELRTGIYSRKMIQD